MEEYIKTLLEQVRCKKAHALIEGEIRGHLEEQVEANLAEGMPEEEAVKAAVNDMGDAVEAGIALDRVHRPEMAWDMVILVAAISIIAIVLHVLPDKNMQGAGKFALFTVVGFVMMLVVYRIDYSFMAKYARGIAAFILCFQCLAVASGAKMSGVGVTLLVNGYNIVVSAVLMLYIPVYGAVVYQYHGTGMVGIAKSVFWLAVPVILSLGLPNLELTVILGFSMAVLLTFAVYKGWFKISKKRFYLIFWGSILLLPITLYFGTVMFYGGQGYQAARVRAVFDRSSDISYMANLILGYLGDCRFIGGSGFSDGMVPDVGCSHILIYLMVSYGIAAGLAICGILILLSIKVFKISVKQKNQLGMMMGCGCGMAFASNILFNIFGNTGLFLSTATFLPFFSSGGCNIVVSYILVGIIMSVYRYKNVFPKHFKLERV